MAIPALIELKGKVEKNLGKVLDTLHDVIQRESPYFDDCLMIRSQWREYNVQKIRGTSTSEQLRIMRNRVTASTITLINLLDAEDIRIEAGVEIVATGTHDDYPMTPEMVESRESQEFCVGDLVLLPVSNCQNSPREGFPPIDWEPGMENFFGIQTQIVEIDMDRSAKVSADDGEYWWAFEWLEKV